MTQAQFTRVFADALCECGCGEETNLAPHDDPRAGWTKGEPLRYIAGHQTRKSPVAYIEEDRGHDTPCWVWQRATNGCGYGQLRVKNKVHAAHRWHYEQAKGPIPEGLGLDHLCRVTGCVNPDHLEPVTHAENMRRGKNTRLTVRDVRFIRACDLTNKQLADLYGMSEAHLSRVRLGRYWRGV